MNLISSFLSFCVIFAKFLGTLSANETTRVQCAEDHYYDIGVQNCEPCSDFCRFKSLPEYVKLCEEHCPVVYRQLMDNEKRPESELVVVASSDRSASSSSSSSPSTALFGSIIGALVVIALVIIIVTLAVRRRQRNKNNNNHVKRDTQGQVGVHSSGRGSFRLAGVEEKNRQQAEKERVSNTQGLLQSLCGRGRIQQESEAGQQGNQEIALLGSSQGSGIQETTPHQMYKPIFKPSGSMVSRV